MSDKVRLPLYLTWNALKRVLGWPYGRSHTQRLETDPKYITAIHFRHAGRSPVHIGALTCCGTPRMSWTG